MNVVNVPIRPRFSQNQRPHEPLWANYQDTSDFTVLEVQCRIARHEIIEHPILTLQVSTHMCPGKTDLTFSLKTSIQE